MSDFNQQLVEILPHLRRHARKIAGSAEDAEDLVQDCVERALRKAHLYRAGTNLGGWLFALMRNLLIDRKRREKLACEYAERLKAETPRATAPVQTTYVFLGQTLSALAGLGAEEVEMFRLVGAEERTYQDTADQPHLQLGTLKSSVFCARARLRSDLSLTKGQVVGSPGEFEPV